MAAIRSHGLSTLPSASRSRRGCCCGRITLSNGPGFLLPYRRFTIHRGGQLHLTKEQNDAENGEREQSEHCADRVGVEQGTGDQDRAKETNAPPV
jgi:hypothetical protein